MWQEPEVPTSALKLCSYMYDTPHPVAASVWQPQDSRRQWGMSFYYRVDSSGQRRRIMTPSSSGNNRGNKLPTACQTPWYTDSSVHPLSFCFLLCPDDHIAAALISAGCNVHSAESVPALSRAAATETKQCDILFAWLMFKPVRQFLYSSKFLLEKQLPKDVDIFNVV